MWLMTWSNRRDRSDRWQAIVVLIRTQRIPKDWLAGRAVATCAAAMLMLALADDALGQSRSGNVRPFEDTVTEVTDDGLIYLREHGAEAYRPWLIVPDAPRLRELVLGNRVSCTVIARRKREGTPIPISCGILVNDAWFSLEYYMMLEGTAIEDCEALGGQMSRMLQRIMREHSNRFPLSGEALVVPDCSTSNGRK